MKKIARFKLGLERKGHGPLMANWLINGNIYVYHKTRKKYYKLLYLQRHHIVCEEERGIPLDVLLNCEFYGKV